MTYKLEITSFVVYNEINTPNYPRECCHVEEIE